MGPFLEYLSSMKVFFYLFYNCAKLGHLLKDCNDKGVDDNWEGANMAYDPWIRATPLRTRMSPTQEDARKGKQRKMAFKPPKSQKHRDEMQKILRVEGNKQVDHRGAEAGQDNEVISSVVLVDS